MLRNKVTFKIVVLEGFSYQLFVLFNFILNKNEVFPHFKSILILVLKAFFTLSTWNSICAFAKVIFLGSQWKIISNLKKGFKNNQLKKKKRKL